VIAALHGVAMGGGLELALGCHYRVAGPGTQISLPEVKLGLLPGAGGTQRLPRAVGLEAALNLIVSGSSMPAEKLAKTGLLDEVIAGDLLAGRCRVRHPRGRAAAAPGPSRAPRRPPRSRGVRTVRAQQRRRGREGLSGAAQVRRGGGRVDQAVRGGSCDRAAALHRAGELAGVEGAQARVLRRARRRKIPDVPEDTPTRAIRSAAVIGAGTMGGGIAMCFANAGIPVRVLEVKQEALDKGLATIGKNYEGSARKGKLTTAQVEERMGLMKPTLAYAEVAEADIVIEAVFEDLAVKEGVFRRLDEVMKKGAILASNTSTLDVNRIAAFTRRPADVIGTHFFSPANVMKLLEIVRAGPPARTSSPPSRPGEEAREDRRGLRRVRRLHRQPHAGALHRAGAAPHRRRSAAAASRRGPGEVSAWPWAPSAWRISRRRR